VYAANNGDQRHLTGQYTDANMSVGTVICRSGEASGYTCGMVTNTNVTHTWSDGTQVNHLWETDFVSIGGDSGGTMMVGYTLGGLHEGHTSTHGLYTTVQKATTNLGVRPCLASTC
jgi:hypothetical protein